MPIKTYKPTTPSRRTTSVSTFEEITRSKPERSLLRSAKHHAGRNSSGRITMWHHGGGNRQMYRCIDFKRDKTAIPAKVVSIEYDPNRSVRIALLHYVDGEKRYILAPNGLRVGATLISGPEAEPVMGNALPLAKIPLGLQIHNIELHPHQGAKFVRSAGLAALLISRKDKFANIKLPSGEIRMINVNCMATIGQLGNLDHENYVYGKAGHSRWLGIRPTVRARAMNPVDHPMGGGEARSTGGHPRSPWGLYAKGKKTRNVRSRSTRFIIKRRK